MANPFSFDELLQRVNVLEHEVSKRKKLEDELRESEEWYQTLAQLSPVGIFRTDSAGNCVYVNRRWSEIAGLTTEEALGEGWIRGLHPEDRERVSSQWYAAAKNNTDFRAEYRFRTPEGITTWVIGNARAVKGPGAKVLGYVGTITDITEHKRDEEALHERIKELTCLYSLSRIVNARHISCEEMFRRTVELIPPACQRPEKTCGRIIAADRVYVTVGFHESRWRLSSLIVVAERRVGAVEAHYIAEAPEPQATPFLKEEQQLIDEIAARLGEALERRRGSGDVTEQVMRDRAPSVPGRTK